MILPKGLTMRYCDQGNSLLLHVRIKKPFHVDRHSTRAFIQDSIFRLMVNQSSHCNSLLFSSRKHVIPVIICIKTVFFSRSQIAQLNCVQNFLHVLRNWMEFNYKNGCLHHRFYPLPSCLLNFMGKWLSLLTFRWAGMAFGEYRRWNLQQACKSHPH